MVEALRSWLPHLTPSAITDEDSIGMTGVKFDLKVTGGQAWAPLNPAYAQIKRGTKILQGSGMRGGLLGSITYQVSGTRITIGTNKIYGAIHQFGGVIVPRNGQALVFRLCGRLLKLKKVTIPRRAFLGISTADRRAITEAVDEALEILSHK